jgi:hypothetical protein
MEFVTNTELGAEHGMAALCRVRFGLGLLELWNRMFRSHLSKMYAIYYAVLFSVSRGLERADLPGKESYQTSKMIHGFRS